MQRRLEKEGISVVKDKIKHFRGHFLGSDAGNSH